MGNFDEFNRDTKPVRVERGSLLDKAKTVINGERQDQYGSPEDNFTYIAEMWTTYMKATGRPCTFTAHDVAMLMAQLKTIRIASGVGTEDSYVDLLGYVALAADMRK